MDQSVSATFRPGCSSSRWQADATPDRDLSYYRDPDEFKLISSRAPRSR
jgi:hypothetical protein